MKALHIGGNRYVNPNYVVAIFPVEAHEVSFDAGLKMYTLKVPHHVAIHIEHLEHPQQVMCETFDATKVKAAELAVEMSK